jgi:hypothetical protein
VKPTAFQTADCLTQIEQLAARLRTLEPNLRHRAEDTALDGYPRQSGPGAGQHGQGDPVGTTVAMRIDHPHSDVLGHAHADVLTKLHQARRLLEQAESAGRRALPPPPTRQNLDDGCVSCARAKTWSPISRTRRCRWCSDWATAHQGDDPPIAILRAHHAGRRITTRLVETVSRYRP